MDSVTELMQMHGQLRKDISDFAESSKKQARAEVDYRKAKSIKEHEFRSDGIPVSLIGDYTKGDPSVIVYEYEAIAQVSLLKAAYELILADKLEIHTLQMVAEREWANPQ